jgi:MFS transporter, ACS family, glucarate transporter
VLWLTVAVYMITYIDRVVIATAAPLIREEFGFSLVTMGWIFSAFQLSYAMFQIPGGWLGDRFGPRRALTVIVTWWSAFTAATALTWSATSMIVCRFLFGMGEAGAFPIATRSLSRWMLPSERGWAQGVTHAGARLGGAVTPAIVVAIIALFGWRAPFFLFALVGLAWGVLWYWYYRDSPREHASVNEAELQIVEQALGYAGGKSKQGVPWRAILTSRQMWVLSGMYFCYAYSITIFLTWFPQYLNTGRGFSLTEMGVFASMPLLAGVVGDMAGGAASDHLYKRSGNLKMARRLVAVVGFVVAGVTMPVAVLAANPVVSVAWFCLGVFALELTVGVSWAVALDIGAEYAGSVSAIMNTCGNIGGAIAAAITGYIITSIGWNEVFFVVAALLIVAAMLFMWIDASKKLYGERWMPAIAPEPAPA